MKQQRSTQTRQKKLAVVILVLFLGVTALVCWRVGLPMVRLASDPEAFRQWLTERQLGGALIYGAMVFFQVLFAVIPGEPLEIAGGYAFGALWGTIYCLLAATLGSLAGALVLYGVGRLLQPRRLDALLAGPVGRALHMEKQDVEKAAAWFAQKGAASVFYCRCVPIVRSLISIPAGMAGMRLVPFFLYTAAGSTVWNILLVGLGAAAGQSWPRVAAAIASASAALKWALGLTAAALLVAVFVRRRAVDAKRHRTL